MLLWWYGLDIAQWYFRGRDILWKGPEEDRSVFLTIDDAVHGLESFQEILSILQQYNMLATFFVISSYCESVESHALLVQAVKQGHQLANHGTRNTVYALCDNATMEKEIQECTAFIDKIYEEAGVQPPRARYFRPGGGYVTEAMQQICARLQHVIVLGTVYPGDYLLPFPRVMSFYVQKKLQQGDIIILHDLSWTPSTLRRLLPAIAEAGYGTKLLCTIQRNSDPTEAQSAVNSE